MEFKDLPVPFQEMASNVVRSQLATLDLSTVEKETIDTISGNVRRAFIGLYEEKQLSDNQDLHEKYFLELMDIINKGFGLLMKKKGIRITPPYLPPRHFADCHNRKRTIELNLTTTYTERLTSPGAFVLCPDFSGIYPFQ